MIFILKFSVYFSFSFLIMSIPIGNKHVFTFIHEQASPYVSPLVHNIIDNVEIGIDKGKRLLSSHKVIKKSADKKEKDELQLGQSGHLKKFDRHGEKYTQEERGLLEAVLSGVK